MTRRSGKTALVFSGDTTHFFAIGTAIINFLVVNPKWNGDIFVLLDKIRNSEKDSIKRISSNFQNIKIELLTYEFPNPSFTLRNSFAYRRFTPMVFSKFEIFRLIENYERILYSDYDVVFLDNIEELYQSPNSFDIAMLSGSDSLEKWTFVPHINGFNLTEAMHGAGLIVVSNTVLQTLSAEYLYQLARKHGWKLRQPEQMIISLVIQALKLTFHALDFNVYAATPDTTSRKSSAKIAHSPGFSKFWHKEDKVWLHYYSSFVKLTNFRESKFPSSTIRPYRFFFLFVRIANYFYRIRKKFTELF